MEQNDARTWIWRLFGKINWRRSVQGLHNQTRDVLPASHHATKDTDLLSCVDVKEEKGRVSAFYFIMHFQILSSFIFLFPFKFPLLAMAFRTASCHDTRYERGYPYMFFFPFCCFMCAFVRTWSMGAIGECSFTSLCFIRLLGHVSLCIFASLY